MASNWAGLVMISYPWGSALKSSAPASSAISIKWSSLAASRGMIIWPLRWKSRVTEPWVAMLPPLLVTRLRIRAGQGDATSVIVTGNETVGVLYMDSRLMVADLAGGNRELLQTLAIEASTVLENARLLQEEQAKHQMEDELRLARTIQQSLLPGRLPGEGWLRASGSSLASHEVGGDYYDVTRVSARCRSAVVADVSGKGVSSALLAYT